MLKHTKSLEEIEIPSWEVPYFGIFPWNPIRCVGYAQYSHKYVCFTISIICHNKITYLMLKHTKSFEISDIPSWEVPHLGLFPCNPIRCVEICSIPI